MLWLGFRAKGLKRPDFQGANPSFEGRVRIRLLGSICSLRIYKHQILREASRPNPLLKPHGSACLIKKEGSCPGYGAHGSQLEKRPFPGSCFFSRDGKRAHALQSKCKK